MATKKSPDKEYISKAGLKGKRGWTDLLIRTFLKEPDLITDNPHYKSAPPMSLWELDKIVRIEETPTFIEAKKEAQARQKIAGKSVDTKKQKILNYVNALVIKLPEFTEEQVVRRACKAYNMRKENLSMERGYEYEPANANSDSVFLNRICVNYLRHQCSSYERQLQNIFGKVGTQEAYVILKAKVNQAIYDTYKFLYPVQDYQNNSY